MKPYQLFCIWTVLILLVITLGGFGLFFIVSNLEPSFVELEKIGLKGVVESIWCGSNGCGD